jgi:group I intron endonuclease
MKICGIYQIQSKVKPLRIYIGSAKDVSQRRRVHLSDLNLNRHHSPKLQNHFNKYGESDLNFSVLLCCDKDDLIKNEQFFIDSYSPFFNCSPNANSPLGVKHSELARKHMSDAHKGLPSNRKGKPSTFKGKHHTEESKEKSRQSHLGRHPTPETLEKMKKGRKGKHYVERQGIRTSIKTEFKKGHEVSDEMRRKSREFNILHNIRPPSQKGCHASPETIRKLQGRIPWNKGMKKKPVEAKDPKFTSFDFATLQADLQAIQ